MDMTTAFLNAPLDDETIFVRPPPGYEILIPLGKSIQLLKALYKLEQGYRMWIITIDTFLKKTCGMNRSTADSLLYIRYNGSDLSLILILYVLKENPIPQFPYEIMNKLAVPPEHDVDQERIFPYPELICCFLYLSVWTRPDISFDVAPFASFVSKQKL